MNGQKWLKSFSIAHHGEESAKALAVAARIHMLRNADDRFATSHPRALNIANERFGDLLDGVIGAPPAAPIDPIMQKRLDELNTWFDALRPRHVHVRVATYWER